MEEKNQQEKMAIVRQVELFENAFNKAKENGGMWLDNDGRKAPKLYLKPLQISAFNAIILGMHSDQNGYKTNQYTLFSEANTKEKEGVRMTKYVLKRLLYMVIVFLLVSLLMYSIYNLIPTDPARAQLEPMKTTLKPEEYEQRYQMLRQQMGLDDPLIVRYLRWIGFWPDVNGELNGMLQGNFGYSQIYKTDVANVLPSRMLNTIYINIFSTLVALAITIPLGIYCAVHKRSKSDNAVQVLSIVGYSIPVYIIALIFIWLFAVTLRWLPVFGMQTPGNNFTGFRAFLDKVYYMTLPVLVMTVGSLGGMTRYVRAAMIEALSMDYIRTARAKGLREKVVVYSHAWRNALLPVITVLIGWFISIFSGSLIIEQMFALNGMGQLYYQGLMNNDFELALAIQMFYVLIALVGQLITDLSYGIVDPRVRVNK